MRRTRFVPIILAALFALGLTASPDVQAEDWPQFQHDGANTGYTPDSPAPPYRARWIWVGPNLTLRNQDVDASWTDDLTSRDGYNFPLPSTVSFSLAAQAQPVIAGGRVFIGDMQGQCYGIDDNDGTTLWTQPNSGGTICPAAVDGDTVVFVSLHGLITGRSVTDGAQQWQVDTDRSIVAPPTISGGVVYVGNQAGQMTAVNVSTGAVVWTRDLGGPIQGAAAVHNGAVYVGSDTMEFFKLSAANGDTLAQTTLNGQFFRECWPVVSGDYVYVRTAPIPALGSEYVGEDVSAAATSMLDEQNRWLDFYDGLGGYGYASPDWKSMYVLRLTDLTEPFEVGDGVTEGTGAPPESPVLDSQGRALIYWKTKYPTLTNTGMFGSNYSADISAIDATNGRRIPIDNNRISYIRLETDNLYGMSIGGQRLFLRQRFRGTQMIDLTDSVGRYLTQQLRYRDGGGYDSDIYFDGTDDPSRDLPTPPGNQYPGRTPIAISGDRCYLTEAYLLMAFERDN